MAIASALVATVLLTGLGVALALMGIEESLLAGHDRQARALRLASESAAYLAVADLRRAPSWILIPALTARFTDDTLTPQNPWDGATLDLTAETARAQADTDASRGPAEVPRVWRLLAYGPMARAAPALECGPYYLVVWVADDGADTDGDPGSDSNGIVTIRADALGPDGGRATTRMSVARTAMAGGPDRVRILTIRPGA
jgi:hypothetical protein